MIAQISAKAHKEHSLLTYPDLVNYHLPIYQQQTMSTTPPIKRDPSWTFDQLKIKYDILWNAYSGHYMPLDDDKSEEDKKRIAELETSLQELQKKYDAKLEEQKESKAQSESSNKVHDPYIDNDVNL